MKLKQYYRKAALLSSALLVLAGCTASPAPEANKAEEKPVVQTPDNELFIFTVWPAFYVKQDIFDRQITQFVKQKFPHIEIKHVAWDDGKRYEDLVAAGTIPDIIMDDTNRNFNREILDNDLQYDLRELIKKHQFDTSVFAPGLMERATTVNHGGAIYGLPFQVPDFVLLYNKDIFNKFGVSYPKVGMTYDEAYELAKRLTRVDGDITYRGYSQHPGDYMEFNQLGEDMFHKTEDRYNLVTDKWIRIVDNLRRFYDIPANKFDTVENFYMDNIAMAVVRSDRMVKFKEQNPNLNYDISTVPFFDDLPDTKYVPDLYSIYITKQSTKKDLAFQVVSYLLSEEHQIELAKEGVVGSIQTDAVKKAFGQNLPYMKDMNTDAVFHGKYAVSPPVVRAEGLTYLYQHVRIAFQPYIFDESKDTVSALRLTEETLTKALMTKKAASQN